jgi:hypothetical protein
VELVAIEYVSEDYFRRIEFLLLFSAAIAAVFSESLPGKNQQKDAENRYSKGFETPSYHTCSEICRKDKGGGVKNLENEISILLLRIFALDLFNTGNVQQAFRHARREKL